ncbi:hypothetical protein RRF57_012979 [Xylaria bambusicola]|uniref:Uncharacterized protein n=1 Tax=Xylaria bambusicola TaxID=326684 RepID=A0AAN7ZB76_9PEZI
MRLLSEDTRVEASRQKCRITNAITKLLHTNMRQARDRGGDSPLPKERTDNTEVSAFNAAPQSDSGNGTGISAPVSLPFLPVELNLEIGPNQNASCFAQPESYQTLHGTGIQDMMTNISDEVFRGSAMVLNPIDGVLDWDISNM